MRKFRHISLIDETNLTEQAIKKLEELSDDISIHKGFPANDQEIKERIGNADCILVSWNTKIRAEVIESSPNLKFIGMCCSILDEQSANVNISAAYSKGIMVKGIKDYGDEGVVEYIFSQVINLANGLGSQKWKSEPTEISGKTLGVIGFGTLGSMVAKVASAFGMKVIYYSRTRKIDQESSALVYKELNSLLSEADIITTHLPRNVKILNKNSFDLIKQNSILINTSLGPTYDTKAFLNWLNSSQNWAIIDLDGAEGMVDICKSEERIIFSDKVVGMTDNAYKRLSDKVLSNLSEYLEDPAVSH